MAGVQVGHYCPGSGLFEPNQASEGTEEVLPGVAHQFAEYASLQAVDRETVFLRQILGQSELVERLLIALLADGHLLVEGAPGLAKTKALKALASGLEGSFHRIQFTPDLLPADLTGKALPPSRPTR